MDINSCKLSGRTIIYNIDKEKIEERKKWLLKP